MNVKSLVVVTCVEAIIYFLLYILCMAVPLIKSEALFKE